MPIQDNLSTLLEVPDLEVTEKNIYYTRPTTIFAAVAASIFTIVGVLGEFCFLYCQSNFYSTYAFEDAKWVNFDTNLTHLILV